MLTFDDSSCKLHDGKLCDTRLSCLVDKCDLGFNLCVSAMPPNAEY